MDGINRINEMAIGQKDFVLLEIVKYLTSREDMNEYYLNQEKDLKGMASYIQSEIIKDFCKRMNTTNPSSFAQEVKYDGKSTKCLAVGMTKEKTFELAINYFEKSNEELGIKLDKTNKKEIKNSDNDDEFGSIFDFYNNKNTTTNTTESKKEEIEQISLFAA